MDAILKSAQRAPFKFLDYYREEDEKALGGRDREIADVVTLLSSRPTLVVFGPSGSGKTSLLRAGVFPRLKSRGWHTVYVRTLIEPSSDLDRAIVAQLGSSSNDEDADSLLAAVSKRSPVVIVFDQFEEFFIRFRKLPDLRRSFARRIRALLHDVRVDCRIVFSLREEYLANLDGLRQFLPDVMENRFRVKNLSAYGAREAIIRPLRLAGIPADDELLSKLVDVLAEFNFDPAILQIICGEVLREATKREADNLRLTISDLEAVGGIEGIFGGYLNQLIERLPEEDHFLARLVLDALITPDRTKRAMRAADFGEGDFRIPERQVEAMLDALVSQKLVRKETRGETSWYELIHERLAPIVHDWIRRDVSFFELVSLREIIVNNSAAGLWRTQPDVLLTEGVLKGLLERFQEWLRFEPLQTEYVLWSVIYRQSSLFLYWRDQFGGEETDRLLLQLVRCKLDDLRRGAAVSIGRIDNPAPELVDSCIELVLSDDNGQVRRAAARALAAAASDEQLQTVAARLIVASTRRRAIAAMAEMHIADRSIRTPRLIDRVKIRRLAVKRRLKETLDIRTERTRFGWVSGVVSGVGWAFTVGLLYLSVIGTGFVHDISTAGFVGLGFSIMSISSFVFGSLFGMSMSHTHARNIVLGRGEQWWRAVVVDPIFLALPVLLVFVFTLLELPQFRAGYDWPLSAVLLVFGIFWVMVPGCVGLARACLPHDYSLIQSAFWTSLTCLAVFPSVGWLGVVFVSALSNEQHERAIFIMTVTLSMFPASLTTAIATGALSTGEWWVHRLSKEGADV